MLRPKGQDSLIAIKKSWELTITELADIDLTIQSMPAMTPTIETAHQVDHDMTLHWLALDSFEITSAAPDEHDIPQSQLMERLRQAAFECQAAEVTPDQQLPHILPSRVIEGQPHLAAGEHPTAPVTGGNVSSPHMHMTVVTLADITAVSPEVHSCASGRLMHVRLDVYMQSLH